MQVPAVVSRLRQSRWYAVGYAIYALDKLHGTVMGTLKGLCLIQWLLVVLGGWSRVQELGTRPSGRSVHVATFHGGTAHEFWIHGGSHGDFSEELWVFDFDTGSWEQRQLNQAPMARGDHVAVWDPNGVLWIHGGYNGVHYFNDLWRYSASTWTNIMAPGPSARSQHVAVWDASNRAIWIHGGLFDCTLNQDLWKFDTQQGTWTLLPNSQHQPFARANHVAVWDEVDRAIWIHAGYNRSCGEVKGGLQQDLWRYDTTVGSNNWNLIAMGGPSARAFHVAGWDPTNRALWIHGGFDGGSFCRDLWRFDVENYAWQLIADKEGPSRRFNHAAAFDVTTTSLCVHGGYSDGFLQHDMWCYQWTTTTTSYTTSISSTSSISTSSTVTSTATSTTTFSRSSTSVTSTTSRSSSKTTSSSLTLSTSVTSSSTISHSSTSSSASTSTSTSTTLTFSITSSTSSSTLSTSSSATTSTSSSTSTTTHSTSTSFSHTQTTSTSATSSSTSTSSRSFSSTTTSFSISFTSTSSTSTTSATKSSTSLTISSSTLSTQTSSSSTQTTSSQTQTSSTSSTITMTTSTSSSMTTTTTTPEDLTAVYILCPLLGFAIVALIILSLLYMRRYCKLRRFVVLPVQPSVPYAYVKWPPSPPPVPPPIPIQLPAINTQELIPPPGPFPPSVVPSNPDLPLLLPELCPSSEAVLPRAIEICITVPSDRARDAWAVGPMCVSPAPPIVEVGVVVPRKCSEREVGLAWTSCRRLPGETQTAPQLPILISIKISQFVLRPIPHLLELYPTSRSACQKVAQQVPVLALAMPDLYKCAAGAGRGRPVGQLEPVEIRMSPPAIPSHLREGPSLFLRAKLGTLTNATHNATPRLPSAIQEPPVLPVRDHGAKVSRSKGSRMVLDEPGIVKRKATKVCACEVSKLTLICLHVSIPRVMQAFHERLQMLPSEPKKVIIRHKGVALSAPPKFQCPSTRKPRQPLGITPPPVLEKPARNPSSALPFGVPVSPAPPAPVTTSTNPVDPVEIQAVGSQTPGAPETVPTVPWWIKPPQRQRRPFRL